MKEDKKLDRMSIIGTKDYIVEEYPNRFTDADELVVKSFKDLASCARRYAKPYGYWTFEVFYNDYPLIPREVIGCQQEPSFNQDDQILEHGSKKFYLPGKAYWSPVTIIYSSLGPDGVGAWLIDNHEELEMVHHATGELTYWLGHEKPDRTWELKDWRVMNFVTNPSTSSILTVNLTFIFSEAALSTY